MVVYDDDIEVVDFDFDTDKLIRSLRRDKATITVDKLIHDGRISPDKRDIAIELYIKNLDEFNSLYNLDISSIEFF